MRKKSILIHSLIVMLMITTLFTGCNNTKPVQQGSEGGEITIGVFEGSVWPPSPVTDEMLLEEAVDKFEEKHKNIKINIKSVKRDQYSDYINNAFLSNEEPDIFYIESNSFPLFASKGLLVNIDEFIEKDSEFHKESMFQSGLKEGLYNGTLYALPRELSPSLLFINKSMLKENDIEIDFDNWTWDQMEQIIKKSNRDIDNDGKDDQFGMGYFWWPEAIYANGSDIFDENGEPNFTDPKVKEAIQYVADMNNIINHDRVYDEVYDNLMNGKYALFPFKYAYYNGLNRSPYMNFDWDVMSMPKGTSAEDTTGIMEALLIGISNRSKNKESAWEFLKFITNSKEGQRIVYNGSEGLPAMKTLLEEEDIKSDLESNGVRIEAIYDVVEKAANIYKHPMRDKIMKVIDEEIILVVKGEKLLDKACEEINNKMKLIIME